MALKQKSTGILAKKLTSKQVAQFLGVSEASVKRWADSGSLPMEKTVGGHRRFRPEDVSVMLREKLKGQPPQKNVVGKFEGIKPTKAATRSGSKFDISPKNEKALVQETFQFLIDGKIDDLSAVIVNLNLKGLSVGAIADRLLCPAMRRVGDLWYRGELSVGAEHLASRTAMQGIERVRKVHGSPDDPNLLALCCSTEGDFHEFPVQVATATLEEHGFEVLFLGPSMPFFALNEVVERFQPRLICVAATMQLLDLERAARDYAQFHKQVQRAGSAIVLGGAGFEEAAIRERFPADLLAENFKQLEDFVEPIIHKVTGDQKT